MNKKIPNAPTSPENKTANQKRRVSSCLFTSRVRNITLPVLMPYKTFPRHTATPTRNGQTSLSVFLATARILVT